MANPKKMTLMLLTLLLFLLTAAPLLKAGQALPYNESLVRAVRETFLHNGKPSPAKLRLFRQTIEKRCRQVKQSLQHYYLLKKKFSHDKARGKIRRKNDVRAYEILLEYVSGLERTQDPLAFQRLALKCLQLEYALRIEARKLASVELLEKIPFSFESKKIPLHKTPNGEASNLINPDTGLYYSQEELIEIKRRGEDVSKLDPLADGSYWTRLDIPGIDVPVHYLTGQDPLHKGIEIVFPQNKAYFDGVRKTQSKPKIDLLYTHNGRQYEFKIKLAAEVYSETTCAALYTALGFSADITKYVKDFKVVLGSTTPHEFKREWETYYSSYDPDKYIKESGEDGEGHYVVFFEGVLESKPGQLIRAGPWAYGGNGNSGMREVRGTLLFNMWVSNLDLKESENNKLVIRKINGNFRHFHIQHDMGFSFGKTYMERPGSFSWNLVDKKTADAVYMNFNCLVDNSLFDHVTYADARWMVRLIVQLTRIQIEDAVNLGGWPQSLRPLLVEKLIARRNQLMEAFGLEGEVLPNGRTIKFMPFDRYLTTPDGVVKNGNLKVYRFSDHPQYFGPRVNEFIALVFKGLRSGIVDSLVNLAGSMRYIVLDPEDFGIDRRFIARIILRMDREIEANPFPTSESDSYLVKDTLSIGLRMGYGSVISGDLAYWRAYTHVYPAATRDAARFNNRFILNVLLPFNYNSRTRSRYKRVVMLEDYFEGRGKVRLRTGNEPLEMEFALTASRIMMKRRFISFEEKKVVFFRDHSVYNEMRFRIFLEFFYLFRSTPLNAYIQKGHLKRTYVEMDLSDMESRPGIRMALDRLLLNGDASSIMKVGKLRSIDDRFYEKKSYLKVLGLVRRRAIYRVDHVRVLRPGEKENRYFQVESRKLNEWRFLDNGERHQSLIRITGKTGPGGDVNERRLTLAFRVNDRSTHNGELKRGYLSFVDGLALKKGFLDFDPDLHTINRLWGRTNTVVNLVFSESAINRLMQTHEDSVWIQLARITGKAVGDWKKLARSGFKRRRPVSVRYTPQRRLAIKTRFLIAALKNARKVRGEERKMQYLVKVFRKAVFISGQTFDPTLLAVLRTLTGENGVYMDALITMPRNRELIFPARVPLYNESGKRSTVDFPVFRFIFEDPAEFYHLF